MYGLLSHLIFVYSELVVAKIEVEVSKFMINI